MRKGSALAVVAALLLSAALMQMQAQDARERKGFAVTLVDPENQGIVFGKTRIAAEVEIADPSLVDRVEFLVGDEVIFVDREAPYECFYDFGEQSRSWVVRAVAHHIEEVSVSDAIVTRKIPFAAVERVNRVILWVSATDDKGEFVTDLDKRDFRIFEDGKEQQVIDFYHETRKIAMAIVIDTSGSMKDKIREVHKAAGAFVESLREIDEALVIDFDDNVFLIQDLTSDQDALRTAIESTEPIGGTALYDAMHAAYRKIGKIDGRKAIVLLSDGDDTTSNFSFNRVLEEAKASNTMIFAIGLGGGYGGGPRRDVLKEFADVTGGRFFMAKKPEELAAIYQEIAEELGKQYFLTYSSTNETWDGRWIKLKVDNEKPGVQLRARRGYFAVRESAL